jgi:cysteinyl-tRNA synthetase
MTHTHRNSLQFNRNDETGEVPPIFGNFFEGWTGLFSNNIKDEQQQHQELEAVVEPHYDTEDSSSAGQSTSIDQHSTDMPPKRKNSVRFGRQVVSEILDNNNVAHAIQILQQALDHLQMTQTEDEDKQEVSKIYSQILKSLCDPTIAQLVNEMSKTNNGEHPDIRNSIMWRLFTKVVESGYVLEVSREGNVEAKIK